MQCPKCAYEPTMAEMQRSPGDCLKCGVNYEGHARHVAALKAQRDADRKSPEGIQVAPAVASVARQYPGAQPVVVVDIKMSFLSMVAFMVKWAFAAIPALLIIVVIGAALFTFAMGFIGGIGGAPGKPTAPKPATELSKDSISGSAEKIHTPVAMDESFWLVGLREVGGIIHMTVRTDFANGSQLYSEFAVNCRAARGMIVGSGASLLTMQPDPRVTGFEAIQPNTPRQTIAARGCRDRPDTNEILK